MADPVFASRDDLALWGLPATVLAKIPTEVQDKMLAGASREIARAVHPRYVDPQTVGDDIKQAVCEIAAWKAMIWKGYQPEGERDPFKDRAQMAWKGIAEAAAGGGLPGIVDATPDVEEGGPMVVTSASRGW